MARVATRADMRACFRLISINYLNAPVAGDVARS